MGKHRMITQKYTDTMNLATDDEEFGLITFTGGEAELNVTTDWWRQVGKPGEIIVSVEVEEKA